MEKQIKSTNHCANVTLALSLAGWTMAASAQPHWEIVYQDDFIGKQLDRSIWQNEVNCYGGGNNEHQCYTSGDQNVWLEDGLLVIEARNEQATGPAYFDDDSRYDANDQSVNREYTSARIRSKYNLDITYGRIEVKARLPEGQGLWPAIWMLPTDNTYGGWPHSGEIDIMEAVNLNSEGADNLIYGTLHYGETFPNNTYTGAQSDIAPTPWDRFHEYAIEWEQNEIRWYIDGQHFATQRPATEKTVGWFTAIDNEDNTTTITSEDGIPFNQRFHLILNVAVGGNWPGDVGAETQFPQRMEVEYVKVYRCNGANASGEGCANTKNAINPDVSLSGAELP